MADGVVLPGAGATVLTDEVTHPTFGLGEAQVMKVIDATPDGTSGWVIDSSGRGQVWIPRPATATVTSVAASASSVTLLALNTSRKDSAVYNDSTSSLYIKLGTTASTTSFTVKLVGGGYYEVAFGYTGRIDGIWDTATGNARITELT